MTDFIYPQWPVTGNIKAYTTTRRGGVSQTPFDSLNIALHVNDNIDDVAENRSRLPNYQNINWLNQTHSNKVIEISESSSQVVNADASFTHRSQVICAVMTADCLPVLLANPDTKSVAAIHAGWRGLADGIIENTVHNMAIDNANTYAWLGPAIGQQAFEVGADVLRVFNFDERSFFQSAGSEGKYFMDIYSIARHRLSCLGISQIYGGEFCTFNQSETFYSYRRDGQTGRMASCIWVD